MMRNLIILFFILIAGCYSPKRINETDLYLSEYVIEAHYIDVYNRLVKGFDVCRENPFESHIDEDKKTGYFNVYEKNPGLGRNKPLKGLGWIEITFKSKFLTNVHFGARRFYEEKFFGKERALTKRWLRWAQGAEVRSCADSQFPSARQKILQQGAEN
jgi:hypothetical protein